jgi:hypothetical protein
MDFYKLSPTQGTIPPDKIVGRTKDLEKLQKTLETQSVVIEEIRRMGKTLFLKKYAHTASKDQKVMYFTLQGVSDVNELIDMLINDLRSEQSFGKLRIGWDRIKKVVDAVKPDEIDVSLVKFKLPAWENKWKTVLAACLQDIAHRDKDEKETLIIILDELPIMIWDWIQNGKVEQSKEFLDVLRKHRQLLEDTGKVRFIICGSIGMEVVLKKLKNEYKYTGEPFNDAAPFSIGAMTIEDALFLCNCLYLDDFKLKEGEEKIELLNQISDLAEQLPFYIHRLFSIIRDEYDGVLSKDTINKSYDRLIMTPQYSRVLKQLEERINIYYSKEDAKNLKSILDYLSKKEDKVQQKEIIGDLKLAAAGQTHTFKLITLS